MSVGLPFESNWTKEQYIIALQHFIKELITALEPKEALDYLDESTEIWAKFVRHLVEQRYEPLFGKYAHVKQHLCNTPSDQWIAFKVNSFILLVTLD